MTPARRPRRRPTPRRGRRFARPGRPSRAGLTLLELVAVVTLMGVFAVVAVSRTGGTAGNAAARGAAERFAALAHAARRQAVLTGETHGVFFERSGGAIVAAELSRWDGNARTGLGERLEVPAGVTVSCPVPAVRFEWDGAAVGGGVLVDFDGPDRVWRVRQFYRTGALQVEAG